MHVTAAPSTNLESVPVSSATNQQSSASEPSTESGSNSNTSCKNKKNAASGKRQQQRQHGNLDDEVRKWEFWFLFSLIDLLIKSLLVRSAFFFSLLLRLSVSILHPLPRAPHRYLSRFRVRRAPSSFASFASPDQPKRSELIEQNESVLLMMISCNSLSDDFKKA
jgi:hypothetical protein